MTSSSSCAPALKRRRLFSHDSETLRKLRTKMVLPGDLVGYKHAGLLKGRGIMENADGAYRACVAGILTRVDRYVSVEPVFCKTQYSVGDVVVGRVAEVQNGRWAVDIGLTRPAVLHLANINLPSNEQRKRTAEDSLQIRQYFTERDLIVAEIQRIHPESGEILLQTRSAKYGLLSSGCLQCVDASLIKRDRSNIVRLAVKPTHLKDVINSSEKTRLSNAVPTMNLQLILSANGWIFICRAPKQVGIETINFASQQKTSSKEGLLSETLEDDIMRTTIVDFQALISRMGALGLEVSSDNIERCYNEVSGELSRRLEAEKGAEGEQAGEDKTEKEGKEGEHRDHSALDFDSSAVSDVVLTKIAEVCWKKNAGK